MWRRERNSIRGRLAPCRWLSRRRICLDAAGESRSRSKMHVIEVGDGVEDDYDEEMLFSHV